MNSTEITQRDLVTRALRVEAEDRFIQHAFNKLCRSLPSRPGQGKRWIYDDVARNRYKPWRSLTEPMQLAMEAGAPEEDVMAVVHSLAGLVQSYYANRPVELPAIRRALRLAINTEADQITAEAEALEHPSEGALERVVESGAKSDRARESLIDICRRKLATRGFGTRALS